MIRKTIINATIFAVLVFLCYVIVSAIFPDLKPLYVSMISSVVG